MINNFTEYDLNLENKYKTIIIGTFSTVNQIIKNIQYVPDLNYNGRTYLKFTIINGYQKKRKSLISSDFSNKTEDNKKIPDLLENSKFQKFTTFIPVLVSSVQDPPILSISNSYMVLSYYILFLII